MKAYYHDHFVLPLPPGHRFPMAKYSRLRERVLAEGLIPQEDLLVSPLALDADLLRVHTKNYLRRLEEGKLTAKEVRRIGFPWSPEMVERSRRSVGGTIAACEAASREGIALNLAGGTHHAHRDFGSGFCVFNDVGVGARVSQARGLADRILILDCDVHQGDGTAAIFADDPSVFTFSIHGRRNFPFRKVAGDLDLALDDGTGDEEYLELLQEGLWRALDQARADMALYLSGADPFVGDSFGRLALTKDGLAARDRMVLSACREAGLPTAVVMGGGYAADVDHIVDIHLETVRAASQAGASVAPQSDPYRPAS
ncbi:MAG: histone deacetylase [Anaerolineales bacterium]|nr:histone deacetylase [Anaerolineales bacterium]